MRRPMFPLGTVLLPGGLLPLHVFEPRYQMLMAHCLGPIGPNGAGSGEFGVVMIERGMEVGGGDVRTSVGVMAKIIESHHFDDGRWAVLATGTMRVRVVSWLDDDPFPLAELEEWPDPPADRSMVERHSRVLTALRDVLRAATQLGDAVADPATAIDLEPVRGGYQAATIAPIGPLDRYRLLSAPTPAERAALLEAMLLDAKELLEFRRQA